MGVAVAPRAEAPLPMLNECLPATGNTSGRNMKVVDARGSAAARVPPRLEIVTWNVYLPWPATPLEVELDVPLHVTDPTVPELTMLGPHVATVEPFLPCTSATVTS